MSDERSNGGWNSSLVLVGLLILVGLAIATFTPRLAVGWADRGEKPPIWGVALMRAQSVISRYWALLIAGLAAGFWFLNAGSSSRRAESGK